MDVHLKKPLLEAASEEKHSNPHVVDSKKDDKTINNNNHHNHIPNKVHADSSSLNLSEKESTTDVQKSEINNQKNGTLNAAKEGDHTLA